MPDYVFITSQWFQRAIFFPSGGRQTILILMESGNALISSRYTSDWVLDMKITAELDGLASIQRENFGHYFDNRREIIQYCSLVRFQDNLAIVAAIFCLLIARDFDRAARFVARYKYAAD